MNGKVFLVGAGPGEMSLITKRGMDLLACCQVVVFDRLASEELLDLVPENCKKIDVGKRVGNHPFKQNEINEILVQEALNGYFVVRLKGGDPFVFGRGGEEILALRKEKIDYEVVPGISSAIAVPQAAGISITHRGVSQSFHVITGHTAEGEETLPSDMEQIAKLNGTLIFLMGIGNIGNIVKKLVDGGKSLNTPVAAVENGSLPSQRVVRGTLETIEKIIKKENIHSPAVIVVGDVVNLDFSSENKGPLSGVSVGITGTRQMYQKLAREILMMGGRAVDFAYSTVESIKNDEFELFLEHLACNKVKNLGQTTWIAFTSGNAVEEFFKQVKEKQIDHRRFGELLFATIGEGTARKLKAYGYMTDFTPDCHTGEGFAKEFVELLKEGDRVYLPRGKKGSSKLKDYLESYRIEVFDMAIYDLRLDQYKMEHSLECINEVQYLTFASASAVDSLMKMFENPKEELKDKQLVVIGEPTGKALEEWGIKDFLIAKDCDAKWMCEKIIENRENKWKD